jgi:hypothetical protein
MGIVSKSPASWQNLLLQCLRSPKHKNEYSLKGQLLIIWLDAADIVGCGGIEGLHEQVQRAAELGGRSEVSIVLGDLRLSSR